MTTIKVKNRFKVHFTDMDAGWVNFKITNQGQIRLYTNNLRKEVCHV